MVTVTKTVRFDAAHVLTGHDGPCRNLHGHTYRVDVSVAAGDVGGAGMAIDFKTLKRIATETVCGPFDHAFMYCIQNEGERAIAEVAERLGMRTVPLPFRTTAENLASHFYGLLAGRVPGLSSVKVWETADSCAEFSP